ncbi:MAG: extracellular solute-binding protein, partial [Alphaproteobacteria bacterium]|nr:extracellular solute-binding protein [Alphaproteobacteria bacterium]
PSNRNLPQVLAGTPILPKHFWEDSNHPRDFNKPSLEVPLGSAAYRVKEFYPSKFIIYERVDNYWGKNLNVSKGKFNYKTIKFQFYRDDTIQMEAFKTGQIDVRFENIARQWANSYDFSAVKNGDVIKNDFRQKRIAPAQVIQFNLRRPLFGGPEGRVLRQALQYLWNFEWINRNLMYNAYVRTQSLFDNSVLQAQGPPSPAELRLLLPFKDKLPADVFGQPYQAPVDSGNNILTAVNLLKANGWYYNNNHQLISPRGQKIEFTLMISSPVFISILQPFVQNVKRIGGKVVLRVMDPAVYERTMMNFDYDATVVVYASSLSPGVEQRLYWGSESANQRGSNNISGVQSPTIDSLLEKLIKADNYNDLTTIARALDRVVMWNYYFIPMHHSNVDRIAWWNKFSCPNYLADSGPDIFYCWIDKKKESALKKEGYKQ